MTQSRPMGRPSLAEICGVLAVLTVASIVVTWPQAVQWDAVNDFGDPLLNTWAVSWVAHILPTHPSHLFQGNIFHPEANTLAYSETLLVPAILVAPFLWARLDPLVAHNLLLLAGYVGSGLTMYLLVRTLTADAGAALIAATAITTCPYRIDQYAKLQLQLVWWIPLVLLAIHRLRRLPRRVA